MTTGDAIPIFLDKELRDWIDIFSPKAQLPRDFILPSHCFLKGVGLNWERRGGEGEQERGNPSALPEQKHMEEENPLQEAFRQSNELSVIKDH